ncbi:MAG: hypothetical protein IJ610_08810 [Bacteroidaceae bacterium]|nr:hypothetical protein [Bacteroidaceae bacterium]
MANYILKEMPDMQKKGKRKVYPKMETYTLKTLDDLAKYFKILDHHIIQASSRV